MTKPNVAFVVQRYGLDVNGGAETLCRLIAERMHQYWEIDVLTSCARDYVKRFENEFSPGEEIINNINVRRFEIDYLRSEDKDFSKLDRMPPVKKRLYGLRRLDHTPWHSYHI